MVKKFYFTTNNYPYIGIFRKYKSPDLHQELQKYHRYARYHPKKQGFLSQKQIVSY